MATCWYGCHLGGLFIGEGTNSAKEYENVIAKILEPVFCFFLSEQSAFEVDQTFCFTFLMLSCLTCKPAGASK